MRHHRRFAATEQSPSEIPDCEAIDMICVSVVRYNAATSDVNHVRLLERRSRAYTCRELMCIVFLPCLLICLLGIACSALVIYYQLDKVGKWGKDGLGGGVGALMAVLFQVLPGATFPPPLLIGGRGRGSC